MKNKKLAIIGKGTAGSMALSYFVGLLKGKGEIDLYYNPETPEQAVGEGTDLIFPRFVSKHLALSYPELVRDLDGTSKIGVRKIDYNGSGDFMHGFNLGSSGVHFNANKLQKLILNRFKSQINLIPKQITTYSDIDATHIIDCSGKPQNFTEYNKLDSIPVNSSYITQCYWESPKFNYTFTIARPYGWVFLIPLQNRCSVGYLYNNKINNLEEIKSDIQSIFQKYNLTPSSKINSFSFDNYYRKENFTDRVSYNGNASFFLEPLEATSIATIARTLKLSEYLIMGDLPKEELNLQYSYDLKETEQMIMMHYFAGSKFKTPFWDYAYEKSLPCMKEMTSNPKFKLILQESLYSLKNSTIPLKETGHRFADWEFRSYAQNLTNLGILEKINNLVEQNQLTTNFL